MAYQVPINNPQLATPHPDRRSSEDLAREADAGSSGMNIEPETPTPMPTNQQLNMAGQSAQTAQPNTVDMMREMHAYMERQQAQINQLQDTLQQTTFNNTTQQQADPNAAYGAASRDVALPC